jgi:hypothetical protein
MLILITGFSLSADETVSCGINGTTHVCDPGYLAFMPVPRSKLPACRQAIRAFFCATYFEASSGPIGDAMPSLDGKFNNRGQWVIERKIRKSH